VPEPLPEVIALDVTPKLYHERKEYYLRQVPQAARYFVNQYFEFIKGLNPYDVMDWLDKGSSLKEIYEKQTFPERIAIAGARGLIKASNRIRAGADQAINFEVTCYTLRFENPGVWEVIEAYGAAAFDKLRQGIDDIKDILKLKEAA